MAASGTAGLAGASRKDAIEREPVPDLARSFAFLPIVSDILGLIEPPSGAGSSAGSAGGSRPVTPSAAAATGAVPPGGGSSGTKPTARDKRQAATSRGAELGAKLRAADKLLDSLEGFEMDEAAQVAEAAKLAADLRSKQAKISALAGQTAALFPPGSDAQPS